MTPFIYTWDCLGNLSSIPVAFHGPFYYYYYLTFYDLFTLYPIVAPSLISSSLIPTLSPPPPLSPSLSPQ